MVAIEYTVVNAREKGRFMATMTLSRLRQARYAILGFVGELSFTERRLKKTS